MLFVAVFTHLYEGMRLFISRPEEKTQLKPKPENLDYSIVCATSALTFVAGHLLSASLSTEAASRRASLASLALSLSRSDAALLSIPSAFTLSIILLLLSPILQTLSKATTSDSIWPLAGSLFFVNAILADYSAGQSGQGGYVRIRFPSTEGDACITERRRRFR